MINGVLRTDLIAQYPSSLYKEYDVYLFTPNPTNGQPSQKSFIPKPQNLIWNTYNSYTITTNFQSETSLDKVKSIRSLADNSYYMSKQNKTLTKDSLYEIFGFLPDNYFNERAFLSQPNNALYMYATYLLYVAKDNSEAFTVSFNQSGKKKPNTIASNMIVDQNSIGLV